MVLCTVRHCRALRAGLPGGLRGPRPRPPPLIHECSWLKPRCLDQLVFALPLVENRSKPCVMRFIGHSSIWLVDVVILDTCWFSRCFLRSGSCRQEGHHCSPHHLESHSACRPRQASQDFRNCNAVVLASTLLANQVEARDL